MNKLDIRLLLIGVAIAVCGFLIALAGLHWEHITIAIIGVAVFTSGLALMAFSAVDDDWDDHTCEGDW